MLIVVMKARSFCISRLRVDISVSTWPTTERISCKSLRDWSVEMDVSIKHRFSKPSTNSICVSCFVPSTSK